MAGGGDSDEATRFDLTALMDVLSNIIFFLMASFGAAVVAGLPVTVPGISSDGETDVARDANKVTLQMEVTAGGAVRVSVSNDELAPAELAPYAKQFSPAADQKIDAKAINDHLWSIKEKFRGSKDVVIVPDDDVTYEMLVELMDASRERKMMVEGKAVFPLLFPGVVVSSRVK